MKKLLRKYLQGIKGVISLLRLAGRVANHFASYVRMRICSGILRIKALTTFFANANASTDSSQEIDSDARALISSSSSLDTDGEKSASIVRIYYDSLSHMFVDGNGNKVDTSFLDDTRAFVSVQGEKHSTFTPFAYNTDTLMSSEGEQTTSVTNFYNVTTARMAIADEEHSSDVSFYNDTTAKMSAEGEEGCVETPFFYVSVAKTGIEGEEHNASTPFSSSTSVKASIDGKGCGIENEISSFSTKSFVITFKNVFHNALSTLAHFVSHIYLSVAANAQSIRQNMFYMMNNNILRVVFTSAEVCQVFPAIGSLSNIYLYVGNILGIVAMGYLMSQSRMLVASNRLQSAGREFFESIALLSLGEEKCESNVSVQFSSESSLHVVTLAEWEYPVLQGSILTITQVYSAELEGSELTIS